MSSLPNHTRNPHAQPHSKGLAAATAAAANLNANFPGGGASDAAGAAAPEATPKGPVSNVLMIQNLPKYENQSHNLLTKYAHKNFKMYF